jgi:RecA-family ATPase
MSDAASARKVIDTALRTARPNGAATPPPLRVVNPCEFQGQPVPERQWIVQDWVPCGVATALYGPGGCGKSLLAQQLMTAVALGKPWLGVPVSPARSIGLFCEDDEDELRRRQAAINHQLYGCDFADLNATRWLPRLGENNLLMVFARNGAGELTPLFEQIREASLDIRAKLVLIDTVADTFGGNQNDAGQVRQYVQFGLARLARDIGGAVLACAQPRAQAVPQPAGAQRLSAAGLRKGDAGAAKHGRDQNRGVRSAEPPGAADRPGGTAAVLVE